MRAAVVGAGRVDDVVLVVADEGAVGRVVRFRADDTVLNEFDGFGLTTEADFTCVTAIVHHYGALLLLLGHGE